MMRLSKREKGKQTTYIYIYLHIHTYIHTYIHK